MACRGSSIGGTSAPPLDDMAERYVRLSLQLAQHQPSLIEAWLGPDSWRPGPRRPVAELRAQIDELKADIAPFTNESSSRLRYLQQQVAALLVAARRLGGESMTFVDEARASFGSDVVDRLDRVSSVEAARAVLEQRLPGRGLLHDRYASFRSRHALEPARVLSTARAAAEICRRRVVAHIRLADSERVEIEAATEMALEARASYAGDFVTRVGLTGSGIDLARLVWLVAHETYPGHHVQHVLADRDLVRAQGWRERALFPSFGRHLLCAEGAAEAGAALLLDATVFDDVCRDLAKGAGVRSENVGELVAVHRAVAELDLSIGSIARAYLDGELGTEQTAARLAQEALVGEPHQFIFTIERQRTRILAYPVGRRLVMDNVLSVPAERRWDRLASINATLVLGSP